MVYPFGDEHTWVICKHEVMSWRGRGIRSPFVYCVVDETNHPRCVVVVCLFLSHTNLLLLEDDQVLFHVNFNVFLIDIVKYLESLFCPFLCLASGELLEIAVDEPNQKPCAFKVDLSGATMSNVTHGRFKLERNNPGFPSPTVELFISAMDLGGNRHYSHCQLPIWIQYQ
jgi:hypothetical protein